MLSVACRSHVVALRRADAFLNPSLSPVGRSVPRVVSLSPIRSLARNPAGRRYSGNAECRTVGVARMCARARACVVRDARACAATERARVKVAESAGQHESTGNVSRELGVGVTAATVWVRAGGREGEGWRTEGETRARALARTSVRGCVYGACTVVYKARAYVCTYVHTYARVALIILHTVHASRPPPRCFEER